MIIKKPYAFLIRNFRLIHGFLFVMLVYLAIRSVKIYDFFSSYISNHYYINQANMSSNYITIVMIFLAVLAVLITFVIYYILSIKNKENRVYLIIMLYYIILIAYFLYMRGIFTGLETKSMNSETQRAFRDISFIVLLPQFAFIFITFLRTLGFNLKQFDFKKDLEELEIDITDNEEVELTVGSDTYKIARFFRKLLRLTKYFILENKMFIIAISSVIVFCIGINVYSKIDVFGVIYSENQDVISSAVTYNIVESYITEVDNANMKITEGKKYILVRMNISNKSRSSYKLGREQFRLLAGNELLIPVYGFNERFSDLGSTYMPGDINSGEDKQVLIVFEINTIDEKKDYMFKIQTDNTKDRYKEVIIKPEKLDSSLDMGVFNFPSKINLKETIFKNSILTISSYDIAEKFKESYEYEINGVKKTGTRFILPETTNRGESLILRIKTSLTLDKEINISKDIKNASDLFEKYGLLRYRYQGNYKTVKLTKIKADYDDSEYIYLQIPKNIETANKLELILLIRGVKYTFFLN